ncbi:DsrE family protein [Urbifossiella limnaea]|uniref:DsrE/DsrF-like family protein n=1 Tax=Urbifossiella limnaea TaxID=2528023 RepID=A0A517XV46_9BACT|nr:DsrE family protein [Urbifossiella limnaea]QDU21367.1 DsrE/DsrF-like family protein [Urbifossiella limnaea]
MKLGIVIYSNDPETVWNAFRFGDHSIKHHGDEVRVFLLGRGVEAESLDSAAFTVTEQMAQFVAAGGTILACGTCLKLRQAGGSEMCPVSTMNDLHRLVAECDKTLTF